MATLADFEVHSVVGQGEFGKVVLVSSKFCPGELLAMKVVQKENLLLRGHSTVSQAITEKQILQEMASKPHPFVVSLHYAFQTEDSLYLLMDFVGGGDLFSLMESKGALPEPHVVVYTAELVLALEHVHSLHIIFRDLKPENVMVGMVHAYRTRSLALSPICLRVCPPDALFFCFFLLCVSSGRPPQAYRLWHEQAPRARDRRPQQRNIVHRDRHKQQQQQRVRPPRQQQ